MEGSLGTRRCLPGVPVIVDPGIPADAWQGVRFSPFRDRTVTFAPALE
jgi:hypothetical protein